MPRRARGCLLARAVGWALAGDLRAALSLRHRRPARGLVPHTDRGGQDTALDYRAPVEWKEEVVRDPAP